MNSDLFGRLAEIRDALTEILCAAPQPVTCPRCNTLLDLEPYLVAAVADPAEGEGHAR